MGDNKNTYLKFIPFSTFKLWDVKRYNISQGLNFENLASLDDILIPYRKQVTKEEMIKNSWRIISKINFGGQLFLREFDEINTYKGNLNLVPENAIIYSKINVRHGCIYYHSKGSIPFGVSSEYPTYTFDETKINGFFLQMVLRSTGFKKLINTKTSGISKARVKQDEFLNIQIPLPPIVEQEQIVNAYHQKIEEAKKILEEAISYEKIIQIYLLSELGIKLNTSTERNSLLSSIRFQNIERWSVDFIKQNQRISHLVSGKYAPVKLKDVIIRYQYGLSEKASKVNIGVPMLRMNNIYESDLVINDLKYISKNKDFDKYKLNKGDLLFNRTNSKELVGKTAIFDLEEDFTFASYLIRVEINTNLADIHYINYLFNSPILQFQKNLVSRQITGQANINAQEMQEFYFPLPPLEKQKEISSYITSVRDKIKTLKSLSSELKLTAEKEFEQAIFKN